MIRRTRRVLAAGLLLFVLSFAAAKAFDRQTPTGEWLRRADLTPHFAHVGRFDVRYVRKGHGTTVFLVHGLASSIYSWSDVINLLAQKFDVVALDLPGFGESSQPADLRFEEYVPMLRTFMDQLGIARAHFVGNSMGGALALLMAANEPERVDHVVVLDSAGFKLGKAERPFIVQLLASPQAAFLAQNLPVRRLLTRATLRHLIHDRARVTDERINEYTVPLARPGALESTRSLLLSRLDEGFVARLSSVRAPTLIVWGRFDPWLPLDHADRLVAALPGSRKVILETGHMPQEEQPADVARIVGEFLMS